MNDPKLISALSHVVKILHLLGIFVIHSWTISTNSQGVTIYFPLTKTNSTRNAVDVNSTSTVHTGKRKKKSPSKIRKDTLRLILYLKIPAHICISLYVFNNPL